MKPVFLDTVGILALLEQDDQWHSAAEAAYQQLVDARRRFVTSEAILLECGNVAARRPYRSDVDDLRRVLSEQKCLIEVDASDLSDAWAAYRQRPCGDAGIVDCISFIVMRQLDLNEAFTNDRHFAAAGFECRF